MMPQPANKTATRISSSTPSRITACEITDQDATPPAPSPALSPALSPTPSRAPVHRRVGRTFKRSLSSTISSTISSTVVVLMLLFAFGAGNVTGFLTQSALAQDDATPSEFGIFWEVWELVERYFVDQDSIDYDEMTYGAIQGMLDSLGDENHTVFFPPEVAAAEEEALSGSFEGIGAYVDQEEGQFIIVAPILGSPAEEAGILAGDVVLEVDGLEITGMPQWEVIDMIRGEAGTAVVLTVLHPETTEPVEIEIVRGRIDVPSVIWAHIPGTDLVHLQITQFAATTGRDLEDALAEIEESEAAGTPVAGIVLDLRNNPGGYLSEALRVGSEFLPEGEVILHERDAADNTTTYRSQGDGSAREIPMVVLVNGGSASAAEIIAGSLQENGRARLIGVATVGTGTVLRPFPLSDGSVVRLGVTNWLTPEFNLIKGQGVQPDVLVEQPATVGLVNPMTLSDLSPQEVAAHDDQQFQTALLLMRMHLTGRERGELQANPAPPGR